MPANVVLEAFKSPTTEKGQRGGCSQTVKAWQRTDLKYERECEGSNVKLPDFKKELAAHLARKHGIPIKGYSFTPSPEPTSEATAATPRPQGSAATASPKPQQPAATPVPKPKPNRTPSQ